MGIKGYEVCEVPDCEDEVKIRGLCAACYSGMRYWRDRRPTEILERRGKVNRLLSRFEVMQPWLVTFKKAQKERQRLIAARTRNAARKLERAIIKRPTKKRS